MTAPLRVLLIGTGAMGSLHARVIAQSTVADLAAIVDPRPEPAQGLAARFDSTWMPELPELAGYDAAVIAAPTEYHHEIAVEILRAGLPLLIEKPVAARFEQTAELLELSARVGVPLMCGLLERFNPAVMTAAAMIGEPLQISTIRHSPYVPRIKTGVGADLLIHDVDLALRLTQSPATRVEGMVARFHADSLPGSEDIAEALLQFESGAIAHLSASRVGQRKVRTLVIQERDRLIEVDLLRRDVTVYRHVSDQAADEDGRGYRQQTIIEIPELVSSREPLAAQLDHFDRLARGLGDADAERASLVAPHEIVERVTTVRSAEQA